MGCYCRTKTPVGGAIFLAHGIMPPMQHNQAAPVTVPATVPTAAAITVYGIAQCDTVKKARAWLAEQALDYHWHDFKKQGVPQALLEQCLQQFGRDALINRKGTTWRKLDADTQAAVVDDASAIALLLAHPSAIKRPIIDWGTQTGQGRYTLGYTPQQWQPA